MMILSLFLLLSAVGPEVIDFESSTVLLAENKANRLTLWEEKGVVIKLAHDPTKTKAKGLVMFFEHLSSGHKGIGNAMALESIPVRATFPKAVSSATVSFWGSTGTPVLLEAFDSEGKVVDRAQLASIPARKTPAEPAPTVTLSVKASSISYIQFSGPRPGEYLAADEIRFTPVD